MSQRFPTPPEDNDFESHNRPQAQVLNLSGLAEPTLGFSTSSRLLRRPHDKEQGHAEGGRFTLVVPEEGVVGVRSLREVGLRPPHGTYLSAGRFPRTPLFGFSFPPPARSAAPHSSLVTRHSVWCRRRESNPHAREERGILSPLRLPFRHSGVKKWILAGILERKKAGSTDRPCGPASGGSKRKPRPRR